MAANVLLTLFRSAVIGTTLLAGSVVLADPPDHAPAHGWRKKNDPRYVGYTGGGWDNDYGIVEGNCNRKEIGTVLGGVVGGAIGSQVGSGDGRVVATVIGAVLGAAVGREIGRDLDEEDRACVGHALELAQQGRPVRWLNDQSNVTYVLTPEPPSKKDAKNCRKYTIKMSRNGKTETTRGKACRDSGGVWKVN
jgi:surface antigen